MFIPAYQGQFWRPHPQLNKFPWPSSAPANRHSFIVAAPSLPHNTLVGSQTHTSCVQYYFVGISESSHPLLFGGHEHLLAAGAASGQCALNLYQFFIRSVGRQ
jgi:hypothetical protein